MNDQQEIALLLRVQVISRIESLTIHAQIVTNTRKWGFHYTMTHDLHWLDMTDRVQFRIATTVYRCLQGMAEYLSELCFPVKLRPSRYQLPSSQSNQLMMKFIRHYRQYSIDTCQVIYLWTSFICCCWPYHLEQLTWIFAWSWTFDRQF